MSLEAKAREIHSKLVDLKVGHQPAQSISDRQRAFLVQYFRRFGRENFPLSEIIDREFDEDIATRFGLSRLGNGKLPDQDDVTVLSKHLGQRGLLIHLNGSTSFRLSQAGVEVAEEQLSGAEAL